jgi:hypothetical protein
LVSSSRCRLSLVTRTAPLRLPSRAAATVIDAAVVIVADVEALVAAAVEIAIVVATEAEIAADEIEVATAAEIADLATTDRETTVLAKSASPKLRP